VRVRRPLGINQHTHVSRAKVNAAHTFAEDAWEPPTDHTWGRVIVVLGYREIGVDGSHGISAVCRAAVRRAESLAAEVGPCLVIFTGWSSNGGATEADQMVAEWKGPRNVALIREPRATNTAENAVRSLQLLRTIEGRSGVITICSILHYPRVRFLFDRLYKRHGYSITYCYVASPIPSPKVLLTELSSVTRMIRDRRAALRLLDETKPGTPHHETVMAAAPPGTMPA
jgi:hypothetical protein